MIVDGGIALGMRRLAIIDVEHGDQPIYNEDRTIAVVCNGELYNYRELFEQLRHRGHRLQSASDVNVLPHLYEESGVDAVRALRGMFAAALWDSERRCLVLWRDRVGKKPLFYREDRGRLAFASELPALLAMLDTAPTLAPSSLKSYLQLGFIPPPETVYQGIRALPPGHVLTWSEHDGITVRPYWRRVAGREFQGTRAEGQAEVRARLDEAVRLRLRSDVPVGLFLSGGIDSSLVASSMARLGARDVKCYTIAVDDPELNEAPAAQRVAASLGLPAETIRLDMDPSEVAPRIATMFGQPFGDSSAVPSFVVARAASAHLKVVLNGDGGDEVFAGYRRYLSAQLLNWWGQTPPLVSRVAGRLGEWLSYRVRRRSALGFAARTMRGLGLPEGERYLAWTTDLMTPGQVADWCPDLRSQETEGDEELGFACHDVRSMLGTDFEVNLPGDLLVKMDIATMANGLEARSPFLDTDLVEFAWSLPVEWLVSGGTTKPFLRSLAAVDLPEEIVRAPKRGFEVPVEAWLQTSLRPLLGDTLLSGASRVARLAPRAPLAGLLDGSARTAGNRAQLGWALLMLELFLCAPTPPVAGRAWT